MWLNDTSCCLIKRMVLQVIELDADAYGANHTWCMIVADDYHGLEWIAGLCYKDLACAQGEHGRIGTSWHIQRGAQSEMSAGTQGEYGQ